MKHLFKVLLASCLFFSSVVLAEKPEELSSFKIAGQSLIMSKSLVGEWKCKAFAAAGRATHPLVDDAWVLSPEDLYLQYFNGIITFNDNGDGSFSVTLPSQDPFYLVTTDTATTSPYIVVADTLYRECFYIYNNQSRSSLVVFNIKRISKNRVIFKFLDGPQFAAKVIIAERILGQK